MKKSPHILLIGGLFAIFLAGCTTSHYRKSADKQVKEILAAKSPQVPNMDPRFSIEQTNREALNLLPVNADAEDFMGRYGEREREARVLNLEAALTVAVQSSRSYQSRKEQLYLTALDFTLMRHRFAPVFSLQGNETYGGTTTPAISFIANPITGQPEAVTTDNLIERQSVAANGTAGVNWLIEGVGKLTAQLNYSFQRFVTGGPQTIVDQSIMTATFTRPLLRNAAFKAEREALIQSERQVLYDLRDFTRYRKGFSVQIATAYFGVLGNRDAARNLFLNLQSSHLNAERSRALAQEGRITQSDLGRLLQQELSAESSWINAVRNYQQALDNFKLQLGSSADADLILNDQDLETLQIHHPTIDAEESIRIALAARLDYLNAKDQLADADRRAKVAASFLKPQVDFGAQVTLTSPNQNSGFQLPDVTRYNWNAGLATVDLGLDRLAERNAYRSALIIRDRAARSIEQLEDEIKLQVRDSWRTLDQARRNYEISQVGVKTAERRVEEQNLLAELGRARAQDQVDAQNSLSDSKNQLTQALVTHTIARLQFWFNLGILYIKENGKWQEIQNAKNE